MPDNNKLTDVSDLTDEKLIAILRKAAEDFDETPVGELLAEAADRLEVKEYN